MRTVIALVVTLCVLVGCRKPQPSPAYTEASGSYTSLLAQAGDEAYADLEMERIEALLDSVPANSSDRAAATELKAKIASERKRVAAEELERQKAMESAIAPTQPQDFGRGSEVPAAVVEETADAGSASDFAPGMTLEALRAATQGCFSSAGPLTVRNPDGTEGVAEMFERMDSTRCNQKYAKYEARFLVFRDQKLVGDFPKSALTQLKSPPAPAPAPKPPPPAPAPAPVVEPGGDKPPTPQAPPTTPGENTGPAPTP